MAVGSTRKDVPGQLHDAAVVERVRSGDVDAFEILVRRHQACVWAVVTAMMSDRNVVEDLAQDVFLKAFAALDTYDTGQSFSSWVKQIARNMVIDEWRRQRRRNELRGELQIELMRLVMERNFPSEDGDLDRLRHCRSMLPTKAQQLLDAFYEKDLNSDQIAKRFSMSTAAVHKGLSRIRVRLRDCIRLGGSAR